MKRRTKAPLDPISALKTRIKGEGVSLGTIAHDLKYEVTKSDVSHFISRRFDHVSKANRRRLRRYFIRRGWIAPRKKGERCVCHKCGNRHTKSKRPTP